MILGIHGYGLFMASGLLLNLTPGQDTMFIIGQSLSGGRRAGVAAAVGITLGSVCHTLAAALGLSAILATSALAFSVVKLAGAGYLVFLGIRLLLARPTAVGAVGEATAAGQRPHAVMRQGMLTNLLNPKVALFFLAFLPQFINPASATKMLAFIVLGASFIATGLLWCLVLAAAAAQLQHFFQRNPRARTIIDRAVELVRRARRAPRLVTLRRGAGRTTGIAGPPVYTAGFMSELYADTARRAARYAAALDARAVAPSPGALAALARFDRPLPEQSSTAESVIAELDELGSPATMATTGGRFFGFVTGGALPVTVAANWLATAWDQNAAMVVTAPVNAQLELVAARWLTELLGLPAQAGCGFVTCATTANFAALAAARHALLARSGWDVEGQGLFGAPPLTVVVGAEVHSSMEKALAMVGFGRARVLRVPADAQGRMIAARMPAVDDRTIVCVQAGNVNTGAFDPIHDVCERARAQGAWVHVDGAFGLWAAAVPALAHLARGLGAADSWGTDAHKWLNVPYDSGLVFVRDAGALRAAMSAGGAYISQDEPRIPYQYTPDFSRRARGIEVWAALRQLGRAGLIDLIERCCRHARRFADGLSAAGLQVLNEVVLNQVLVSFGTAERTRSVIRRLQEEGSCWCGGTIWQDQVAMRISVSSWATTAADVERSLAAIVRVAQEHAA